MFHCRSLTRTSSRLAARVFTRSARSQIRWQSQESSVEDTPSNERLEIPRKKRSPSKLSRTPRHVLATGVHGGVSSLGACSITGQTPEVITLRFDGLADPIRVWSIWLRDICPCDACVEHSSGQKRFYTHQIPTNLEFESAEILEDGNMCVKWRNDISAGSDASSTHTSTYPTQYLLQKLAQPSAPGLELRELWNVAAIKDRLGSHDYVQYMQDDEVFGKVMGDLRRHGIVILNEVPASESAVEEIAQRIGPIMETLYGRTWDVKSKPDAENIAYTNEYLAPHQDLLYWSEVPRLQVLHCLRNDCDGGESLFVDGFLASHHFDMAHPRESATLRGYQAHFAYEFGGHVLKRSHHVTQLGDKTPSIRWSPPFQAPFAAPYVTEATTKSPLKKWHQAAVLFGQTIESKDRMLELKLMPGQAVLFDNLRILHGRNRFNAAEGERWLRGTYLSSSAFVDKLHQVLGQAEKAPNNLEHYRDQTRKLCQSEGIRLPTSAGDQGYNPTDHTDGSDVS